MSDIMKAQEVGNVTRRTRNTKQKAGECRLNHFCHSKGMHIFDFTQNSSAAAFFSLHEKLAEAEAVLVLAFAFKKNCLAILLLCRPRHNAEKDSAPETFLFKERKRGDGKAKPQDLIFILKKKWF